MNLIPVGTKLLAIPIAKKEEALNSGIIIPGSVNANLLEAEVVAVSAQISHLFKIGDIVLYPEKVGVGQILNGVAHLWLDAEPNMGQIWGIANHSKPITDKGDSL